MKDRFFLPRGDRDRAARLLVTKYSSLRQLVHLSLSVPLTALKPAAGS